MRTRSIVQRSLTVTLLLAAVAFLSPAQGRTGPDDSTSGGPMAPPLTLPPVFHSMPVHFQGRPMPMTTAGRLVVYRLSGRRSVAGIKAEKWVPYAILDPFLVVRHPIFLVNDPATLRSFDYPNPERRRYAYAELHPYLSAIKGTADFLDQQPRELSSTEEEIISLAANVRLFEGIASTLDPFRGVSGTSLYDRFLSGRFVPLDSDIAGSLALVPTAGGSEPRWLSPGETLLGLQEGAVEDSDRVTALLAGWDRALKAYRAGDQPGVAAAGRELRQQVEAGAGETVETTTAGETEVSGLEKQMRRVRLELAYDVIRPLFWTVVAFLGALGALGIDRRMGRRRRRERGGAADVGVSYRGGLERWAQVSQYALLIAGVVALTIHQVVRFLIMARPPVTDLPSSFVFVAWLISLISIGLSFKRSGRREFAVTLSSTSGLGLLFLARMVSGGSDPFGVVQAVLDTNFWLTTHVLVITAGYALVIAAGVAAHVYLLSRRYRPYRVGVHSSTYHTIHRFLIAGLAFTFLGTVLGGIWADQSWGRFWGWDPKENGALLIIIWVSIVLHARIVRWLDAAGFAAASVVGVVVVLFSWLGVNLMGVGLHSYGFTNTSFIALVSISAAEFVFAGWFWSKARTAPRQVGLTPAVVDSIRADGDAAIVSVRNYSANWSPGQSIGIKPEGFSQPRMFSPVDTSDGVTRFLIAPSGKTSYYLANDARPGEVVEMTAPSGEFGLASRAGASVVLVAGGVGLAPLVGMANLSCRQGNPTWLVVAGRTGIYLKEDIDQMQRANPALKVHLVLSSPAGEWNGAVGRLDSTTLPDVPDKSDWYICGSSEFCDAIDRIARRRRARSVFREEFTEAGEPVDPPPFPAPLRISSNGHQPLETIAKPGQTLLAAALKLGPLIPYSCMSGTCGDCACTVQDGQAVQSVAPRVAGPGDRIHPCVSYPLSEAGVTISVNGGAPGSNSASIN